ncbi:hypothetical protein I316_05693 [Kwoniella heveanensis BCC8398]|uniref:Uncharacterized protein n=1 Tax=Kwoniella heveanensis BCC8398 TaxID=1296120 RepID=A0A1B9GNF5_9TREE|nr:hypothetical protein I316_05693 [Kwoniella heveanensis BCC8398]
MRKAESCTPSNDSATNTLQNNCDSCATFNRAVSTTPGANGRLLKLIELSDRYFSGPSSRTLDQQQISGSRPSTTSVTQVSVIPKLVRSEVYTILDTEPFRNDKGRFSDWFDSLDGLPEPKCCLHSKPEPESFYQLDTYSNQARDSVAADVTSGPNGPTETVDCQSWTESATSLGEAAVGWLRKTRRAASSVLMGDDDAPMLPR